MKVQGSAVLIRPDVLPEKTSTGKLVVPKSSKEMLPCWGTVVDCGPACKVVNKGDRVNFPRRSASVMVMDGKELFFTYEHKLFYIPESEIKEYTCVHCGHVFKANLPASVCSMCY